MLRFAKKREDNIPQIVSKNVDFRFRELRRGREPLSCKQQHSRRRAALIGCLGRLKQEKLHWDDMLPISESVPSSYRVSSYRVSGYRVSSQRVSGYRVSSYRVSGYRVSGDRVSGYWGVAVRVQGLVVPFTCTYGLHIYTNKERKMFVCLSVCGYDRYAFIALLTDRSETLGVASPGRL